MSLLLGVDVGTLSTKIVLADIDGKILGSISKEHDVHHPHPGWAEHNPLQEWWGDFVVLTRELLMVTGVKATSIKGVGVVGAFPSPCLVDADGIPIRNAVLYSDNRAEHLIFEVNQKWGMQLTGDDVTPRLLWLKRNEPKLFDKTSVVLNAHNFIVSRLTGVHSIDFANATWFGGLYDYASKGWHAQHCAELGIPESILPQIYPADAVVGGVTRAAAEETGLGVNTPVIAGSGDMYMAMLGSGAVAPGDAIIYYGTAGLLLLGNRPFMEVIGHPFLEESEELALLIAYIQASGEVVRWLSRLVSGNLRTLRIQNKLTDYAILDEMATQITVGSQGVLVMPHFLGERSPRYQPKARGCIYGLTPDHTVASIHRAVLESFGFGIKHSLLQSQIEKNSIRQVFACGGGARSTLWRQIVSDILGLTQIYIPKASSALGAAYLAGVGIGVFPDWEIICQVWLKDRIETIPNRVAELDYRKYFENYMALYNTLTNMLVDSIRGG